MKQNHRSRTLLLILLFVLLAAAGGLYYYGYTKLEGLFLPNTFINGIDVSLTDPAEIDRTVTAVTTKKKLVFKRLDGTEEEIPYADLDYHLTWASTAEMIQKLQNHWLWPLHFFEKSEITVDASYTYSREKLAESVAALECISGEDIRAPKDAAIVKKKNGYVLRKSDDGTTLDEEAVLARAEEAVEEGSSLIDLKESGCYLKAKVHTDDEEIQTLWAHIDNAQKEIITLELYGSEIVIDQSVFKDWLVVDHKTQSVYFDAEAVGTYVEELAAKLDTYKKLRQFKTTAGDMVTVGGSDNDIYGFLLQKADTKAALLTALDSGESQSVEAIWDRVGKTITPEGDDIGSTYVEISIDQQHMWFYKDGELLVSTPVVTGLYNTPSRRTPTGVFQLIGRLTDYTMTSYGISHTNFAMPINHDGIYIHDSSWRSSYGGEIYINSGSHGCINTPYDGAKAIYELVPTNTPVIVYDRIH